jgi:all-trans-retinol 13,14-reductase
MAHYADGAFFPRGGPGALRDALQAAAESQGASFLSDTDVTGIVVEHGRVVGVRTANGEVEAADVVVADVDPRHVFGHLLPSDVVPSRLHDRTMRMESSLSGLMLHLGLKRDLRDHGVGRQNFWLYPSYDIDAQYRTLFAGELPKRPGLFVSPSSTKDPSGKMAPPGGSSLEILTFAPYSLFSKWKDGAPDGELAATKEMLTRWILDEVERQMPGVIGDVEVCELSTPLAFEHHLAAIEGGLYGPAVTTDQSFWHRFAPATFIPNLYLAGSGVFGMGVMPCLVSGVVAAQIAVRKGQRAWRRRAAS